MLVPIYTNLREVPALNEVPSNIASWFAERYSGNVVPRHTRRYRPINVVLRNQRTTVEKDVQTENEKLVLRLFFAILDDTSSKKIINAPLF